ncbi:MAG: MFS transporter, partial [Pseudonocardiaceae bacterium]
MPGLATLVLRQSLPESPRWLLTTAQEGEAREVVNAYLGQSYFNNEDLGDESTDKATFTELFSPKSRTRTAFTCFFYTCLVAPYFAIFTFAPPVFSFLGVADPRASVVGSNIVAVLG